MLFDPNKPRALRLSPAGLDACCLGDSAFFSVHDGFLLMGAGAGSEHAAEGSGVGREATDGRALSKCWACNVDKPHTSFSKNQLKRKGSQKRCLECVAAS